ncbi:N-ATPase subunit AtpR [Methylobacter luteus]|uniref:N-ATPase subunit AtpR n=1 Tax=Methylobacter luteus TaxID=415 RepID=UPI0009DC03EF
MRSDNDRKRLSGRRSLTLRLIYFDGLWLTVRRLPAVQYQALWMLGSFILRNMLIAAGFYAISFGVGSMKCCVWQGLSWFGL